MEHQHEVLLLQPVPRLSDRSYDRRDDYEDDRTNVSPLSEQASVGDSFVAPERERDASIEDQEQDIQDSVKERSSGPESSTTLHRSAYILVLVLLYTALALYAWVVTCILSYHPITARHYEVSINKNDNNGYGQSKATEIASLFAENEKWFTSSRIIQSIVSVLTIPLTSAVCSSAAVIFVQHHRTSLGFSIRKVMALADTGWTDPAIYARILLTSKGWKRYGSSFLLLAISLVILGGVISPIQQLFLSTNKIKVPTSPLVSMFLLDIPDQWQQSYQNVPDSNLVVVRTRSALASTTNTQGQAQLWQGAGFTCDVLDSRFNFSNACNRGATFGEFLDLRDPFLAEMPSGYNIGLIRQFVPRINSTALYAKMSATDFPTDCDKIPGAFFAHYANTSIADEYGNDSQSWSLQACMPTDLRRSPWRNTRDRQDFSEELFINVTIIGFDSGSSTASSFHKVTINTTAGYFELPNYMNGGVAGSLLALDPNNQCGTNCLPQGPRFDGTSDISDHNDTAQKLRRTLTSQIPADSLALEIVYNKGPLLTTAMALFGEGSFLANSIARPQAYGGLNRTADGTSSRNAGACIDLVPLGSMLADNLGQDVIGSLVDSCVKNTEGGSAGNELPSAIADWILNFRDGAGRMANAFTTAAFLANQAWMMATPTSKRSLTVSYDLGIDTQIPVISRTGVVLISALLGVDLLALLAMAIYACLWPRWTNLLDSFAMLRLGATIADKVPLLVGRNTSKIEALDEIPGWIGDTTEPDEEIGQLGLGAAAPLKSKRRYRCYDGDNERVYVTGSHEAFSHATVNPGRYTHASSYQPILTPSAG